MRPETISIVDAGRQAGFAVSLIVIEFATIATYRATVKLQDFASSGSSDAVLLLLELFRSGVVILLPLVIVVTFSRQSAQAVGIRRDSGWKMIALGLAPSMVFFIISGVGAPLIGAGPPNLNISVALRLINNLVGGFSEEAVFRGHIQTRLVARTTKIRGWLAASLAFSLWHLPVNYLVYGGIAEAFSASLLIQFPLGLAFGYIMMKAQNILPSSIFHAFFNWTPDFFGIPMVT